MSDAILAPSLMAASFFQTSVGKTRGREATVENPQSVPAITRSRPTMFANRMSLSATSSGCSIQLEFVSSTPGIRIFSSGISVALSANTCASWASELLDDVTGVAIDADDWSGFETPRELGKHILELEKRKGPSSRVSPATPEMRGASW